MNPLTAENYIKLRSPWHREIIINNTLLVPDDKKGYGANLSLALSVVHWQTATLVIFQMHAKIKWALIELLLTWKIRLFAPAYKTRQRLTPWHWGIFLFSTWALQFILSQNKFAFLWPTDDVIYRSYLAIPANSWVDDYIDWLNPGSRCCRLYTIGPNSGQFCPASQCEKTPH